MDELTTPADPDFEPDFELVLLEVGEAGDDELDLQLAPEDEVDEAEEAGS